MSMTTRQKFEKMLFQNGMFEEQARKVMDQAIPVIEAISPDYRMTWDRPADEYPDAIYSVLWPTVRKEALKWIDTNIPKAWFRGMFL